MKNFISIIVIMLSIAVGVFAEPSLEPLEVTTSEKWETEYNGNNTHFYAITRKAGESALLMLSEWPAAGNYDQIPVYLNQIAEGFLNKAEEKKEIVLSKDGYMNEKIKGNEFSGQAVIFTVHGGLYQTMFMISDGDGIWSGQFSGSKERWIEAIEILKNLKRK